MRWLLLALMLPLLLAGCSENGRIAGRESIDVDFVWDLDHPERSPEIHLQRVPAETVRLQVLFFDATNQWEHGGGDLPFDGSTVIPAGAVEGFKGLSSTWGFPKFEIRVSAYDKQDRLVAKGGVVKSPPDS